jgi:hypothetical protein
MISVAYNSFLPLMAIVLVSLGWWIISMKAMAIDTKEEDFVQYARYRGVGDNKVMVGYVARTACPAADHGAWAQHRRRLWRLADHGDFVWLSGRRHADLSRHPVIGLQPDPGHRQPVHRGGCHGHLILDIVYPFIDPRIRYK